MSRSTRLITPVYLVIIYSVVTSSSGCVFPLFMTQMPFWKSHVTEQRVGAYWIVKQSRAELTEMRPPYAKSTFDCLKAVGHDTFLTDVTTSQRPSYQCLRFIRRSDFVVQLARSKVFATNSSDHCLHSDRLVVDQSPLVQSRRNEPGSSDDVTCGLAGGYWLDVTDPSGRHTCRQAFLNPIIESDCVSPGEGVLIDFRQLTCARSLSDSATLHRLVCLGSWTQYGLVFSVLTDNKDWPKLWMLRVPEGVAHEPITAHLMTSLSTDPAHNTSAHALSLTPASFPTLCENEATRCDVTKHCADDTTEVHCQKTCNACAVTPGGSSCQFNDSDYGQWIEMTRRDAADDDDSKALQVTLTNTTLQLGTQPALRCIEFSSQQRYQPTSTAEVKRRPVALLFAETGCRPRVACLEVLRRSDAVLQYRIGRPLKWPHETTASIKDSVCSDEMFTERVSQYKTLISRNNYSSSVVPCGIDAWYHINGSDPGGRRFDGYIDACGSDVTEFRYVTVTSSPVVTSSREETHRCLATFTVRGASVAGAKFTYIITHAAATDKFYCWLVEESPLHRNTRLYLSYAADCRHVDTGVESLPGTSHINYLARFDMISSDSEDGHWVRNCSSHHQVPDVVTSRMTSARMTSSASRDSVTTASTAPVTMATKHVRWASLSSGMIILIAVVTSVVLVVILVVLSALVTRHRREFRLHATKSNSRKSKT